MVEPTVKVECVGSNPSSFSKTNTMEHYISEIDILNRIKMNKQFTYDDKQDFSFNTSMLHIGKKAKERLSKPTLTNQQRNKLKQKT